MLSVKIRFESSWTNALYTPDASGNRRTPLFTSGSALSGSTRKIEVEAYDAQALQDPHLKGAFSRVPYLRALQARNPELAYRVPESFDNTVVGTLARLMGETRRISDVRRTDPDHLALRAFAGCQYELDLESEHTQVVTLATYEANDIQSGGAGLIQNQVLFGRSPDSQLLFGHLGLSVRELEAQAGSDEGWAALMAQGAWTPASPAQLIDRLTQLADEQKELATTARKAAAAAQQAYSTVFPNLSARLAANAHLNSAVEEALAKQQTLAEAGKAASLTVDSGALEGWNLAAALIVAKTRALSEADTARLIEAGALSKAGNLPGLAMSGSIGNVTAKDMFKAASGQPMKSYSLPYTVDVPVLIQEKKQYTPSGVLKKTGTLTVTIEDEALADEVAAAVAAASVGPFHFGKKGIAYVQAVEHE